MEAPANFFLVKEHLLLVGMTEEESRAKYNRLWAKIIGLDRLYYSSLEICSGCKELYYSDDLEGRIKCLRVNSDWALPSPQKMLDEVISEYNDIARVMLPGDFGSRINMPPKWKCPYCRRYNNRVEKIRKSQIEEGYEDCFRNKTDCDQLECKHRAHCFSDQGRELRVKVYELYSQANKN